jgi:hypothetical protein|tara:strand:- start:144 stop:407 length:264 start_codon:yes stop_codon:yes gene_type:complete
MDLVSFEQSQLKLPSGKFPLMTHDLSIPTLIAKAVFGFAGKADPIYLISIQFLENLRNMIWELERGRIISLWITMGLSGSLGILMPI